MSTILYMHKLYYFARGILGLLMLQFILGMLANLYSTVPQVNPWEVFHQFGFILIHALNGILLLILSTIFLIQSIRHTYYKREAVGGFVSLIIAFATGEAFVFTQINIFSLIMALAFLSSFLSYAIIIFSTKPTS